MMQLKKYFINLFDPKILAAILIFLAASIILTMIFSQKVPDFKQKYKGKFYTYVFSVAFIYSIITFLGYNKLFQDNNLYEFIFYQLSSLVIGIIHCSLYRTYFKKFGTRKNGTEYLFALLTVVYSTIPFILIFTFLNGIDFSFLMLGHFFVFFIPTFLNDTFNRAMAIPPKIYKTWQFPENYLTDTGLSDAEMKNMVVFTFLMDKDVNAKKYSVYRAKGPTLVEFGRLFFNFVLDYNDKHPNDQIQIEDENGLFNWVFFLQPKWYESTKYIDPDLILHMNGIEENSVIFCMRTNHVIDENSNKDTDYEFSIEGDRKRNTKKEGDAEVISQDQ